MHRPLVELLCRQESVVGIGDHVDDGIADAQYIEAGSGHDGDPVGKMSDFGGG